MPPNGNITSQFDLSQLYRAASGIDYQADQGSVKIDLKIPLADQSEMKLSTSLPCEVLLDGQKNDKVNDLILSRISKIGFEPGIKEGEAFARAR